ncbi:hypothetical protein FE783_25675 [Paenibacillus mesophilus]|uniref:hypothetical protein n=1 Tax=Paenibacillus mesophilus TaxID=2582849 RepID=UPI00110F4E73|nr:hypothetical protein [Paenibacillus mesophilus]TMV46698.1 hypothetical protein FE783_25675 [Paenibacillus mesophilus]
MKLEDALFNWLQIRLVADARPDDNAAKETESFFAEILRDDHKLGNVHIANKDDTMIHVRYEKDGKPKLQMYDKEHAEQLLADINSNPKYN